MDYTKKQPAILYLDKNGFYFYTPTLPSVISLAFIESSVKDMEVINPSSILTQVRSFIDQYQIPPTSIMMILSPNITFEKDIAGLASEAQEESANTFIDTIPFESVLAKQYPIEKGVKVIGANDDLYQELRMSFEKSLSSIDCVVPYQILGSDQVLIRNFTTDSAQQLLKRIDHLKQYTMLSLPKEKTPVSKEAPAKTTTKPNQNKTRLIAMVGVFAFLFVILGIMLLRM